MLEQREGQLEGEHHSGVLRQEMAAPKAGRIRVEAWARLGWAGTELTEWRKNDSDKLAIAAGLHRETTLSLRAISGRVHPGSAKRDKVFLRRWMREVVNTPKG